jgi:parallel beta-helix repeat protein
MSGKTLRTVSITAALLLGSLGLLTPAASAADSTFVPVADSYVDAAVPATNFGSKIYVYTDADPVRTAYLKFDVQGVTDFSSAKLRLFVESSNSTGVAVHSVSDTGWGETTINATNAPAAGASLGQTGPVQAGTWVTVSVTPAVTANGLVSFALVSSSNTALKITSKEGTNKPQLVIGAAPSTPSSFLVSPRNPGNYQATSTPAGTTYNGSLKSVGERAAADLMAGGGGTLRFTAGTFDFGSDFFKFDNAHDIVFEGAGIDATIIKNNNSSAADTEPFNFSGADRVTIRDLTVSAQGAARTTSDALDFDRGNSSVVDRVKITASRGRGIVFDGKNLGWNSAFNTVRDCVISGTASSGIELLASTNNTIQGCRITGAASYGIQANKSSAVAPQPNKKSSDNLITGNTIDQSGRDGINVNSGDRNRITGNTVTNSADLVASRDGIRLMSADSVTCDDNSVSGNTATDNQSTKTQKYGLHISSSLCNRTVVGPGNNFAGNLTAPIRDIGTGTITQ